MRLSNSIKNAIVAAIMNIVTIIIGFIAQRVFIRILGTEYLGINGLFSNILSMLSIVELGLGTAIIYHLYKPVMEENKEEIKSLMQFYKISYRIIAITILIIGLLIIPFLNDIVGDVNISDNIIYIYILFLIDVIVSYLLTYKRSIIYANQKTYIANLVHIAYLILMNTLQLIVLKLTKNYFLYLWIKIIFRIIENTIITIISNKMYPYIKDKKVKKLEKNIIQNILKKVRGLMYHRIAGFVVLGTDNIMISKFFGVATVGLYSNYNLIIQALSSLFTQAFSSITASVGNLLTENDKDKNYQIYKNMLFLNSWISAFICTGLLCVIEPFIKIWVGSNYILPYAVLIVLVINFYMQCMRKTCSTFKEAAGIFYEDRYVPVLEAVINIIASLIFLKIFGLLGVFLGTIASTFILFFYSYPKFVYKNLFKNSYIQYYKDYVPYVLTAIVSVIISQYIISNIKVDNDIFQIIINIILVCIIPNAIHFIMFRRKEEFKYYKDVFKSFIKKKSSNKK